LARSLGRFDWWNLRDEHTPFQWQAQLAMYFASPWGERRADLRQAISTANLMMMQCSAEGRTQDQFSEIIRGLTEYLPGSNTEETADLEALKLMRASNGEHR
jgi:hypothetical protein